MFVIIFTTYVIWEIVATAPQGLVSLLGIAGGAWFGAVSGDKKKRDADTEATAHRAEATADRAERSAGRAEVAIGRTDTAVAEGDLRADVAEVRADDSEERESGWSQHRDHNSGDEQAT